MNFYLKLDEDLQQYLDGIIVNKNYYSYDNDKSYAYYTLSKSDGDLFIIIDIYAKKVEGKKI